MTIFVTLLFQIPLIVPIFVPLVKDDVQLVFSEDSSLPHFIFWNFSLVTCCVVKPKSFCISTTEKSSTSQGKVMPSSINGDCCNREFLAVAEKGLVDIKSS